MWAGMTSPDYELVGNTVRHKPSGMSLSLPASVQFNTTPNPHVLSLPSDPALAARLLILDMSSNGRAREMGEPYETAAERERFRRRFGALSKLQSIAYDAPGGRFPWDARLVEALCDLFFVKNDLLGYYKGGQPYPDVLELNALELPASHRGRVSNRYAALQP